MENRQVQLKTEIRDSLNEQYKRELLNYEKCIEIKENYEKEKQKLLSELSLSNEASSITKSIKNAETLIDNIDDALRTSAEVAGEIDQFLQETSEDRHLAKQNIDKLNTLECALQYLKVLQHINLLNERLAKEIKAKDDEQCATIFANLSEVFRHLVELPPMNVRKRLKEMIHYWHGILKEKFAKDYEEILKALKWPFVNANFNLQAPSQAHVNKMQVVAEYLLQIELPSETTVPLVTSALLSDFPPLCMPIHYLLIPLKKRFLYHFYGDRQTNRIDKPEWYFTQILTWIRDHKDHIRKWIQPIIDKLGMHHIDAEIEFIRGLVQIVVEKLNSDLPTLQYDDYIFSHSVDEALSFNKELIDSYGYPASQPSVLAVLTQAQVFQKWLFMERKYAMEKMDIMLSTSAEETFQTMPTDETEDLKIPLCADMFVTLLQTISERYDCLPQPGHRLQFLDLQTELLDDFRVRLLQIVHAENGEIVESKIPMIANTLHYIENVLIDWGAMLQYLNLYYYKTQMKHSEDEAAKDNTNDFEDALDVALEGDTVFADTLSLYRNMYHDLVCTLAESVLSDAKKRSRPYLSERWIAIPLQKDQRSLFLTQSACPMFEIIGTRLHQLEKCLTAKLFGIVWRSIAKHLDTFLFEELVLENRFSEGGAFQFKYDVTRNLLPLFSQFSSKPNAYFTRLTESCNLLNITKGSALLLRETLLALEEATGVEDMRGKALAEVGVVSFQPKEALIILNRRTDITINRLSAD